MKKRLLIAIGLILILTTYKINLNFEIPLDSSVKQIIVKNNNIVKEEEIKKKLAFLYDSNIFSLKKKQIKQQLNEIDFIDSFEIKKIYPDKIIIKIYEKKPIAILQNKKEKKYFTKNGEVIAFFYSKKFENLPIVFGNESNFNNFYINLIKTDFPIENIKTFYFFESNRWDLVTKQNQTIKLPIKNFDKSLKNFLNIKNQSNFEKYKVFDYRISNQLILK